MDNSVGQAIRQVNKNGLSPSYFLLGDDFYLQNIFKKYIKNKFGNDSIIKHLDLNEALDLMTSYFTTEY